MLEAIKEHMDVIGSDGGRIGRVDHVKGNQIELAKLHLNLTEDEAKARWTDKP